MYRAARVIDIKCLKFVFISLVLTLQCKNFTTKSTWGGTSVKKDNRSEATEASFLFVLFWKKL